MAGLDKPAGWNFDSVAHDVKLKRMVVASGVLDFQNQVLPASPNDRTGTEVGHIPIFNYGTDIQMTLELEAAGKPRSIKMKLKRRTVTELKRLYAPGGVRPYPWGARGFRH